MKTRLLQPTFSMAWLLLECSFPFLRQVPTEEPGEPARWGSCFHELMAVSLTKGKPPTLRQVTATCNKFDLVEQAEEMEGEVRRASLELAGWMSGENPWGYDFTQKGGRIDLELSLSLMGKEIRPPRAEDHFYEDLSTEKKEMGGTLDLVAETDEWILVLDHKTGRDDYSQPERNPQLMCGLVAAVERSRAREGCKPGSKRLAVAVLHAQRGGLPMVIAAEVQPKELSPFRVLLSRAIRLIGSGNLRPGSWCARCPLQAECVAGQRTGLREATDAISTALATINPPVEDLGEGIIPFPRQDLTLSDGERIGKLHQLFAEVERVAPHFRAMAKEWVRANGGFSRPDGKTYGLVTKQVERISKESILRALGKVKGLKELERLRKLGALEMKEQEELRGKYE